MKPTRSGIAGIQTIAVIVALAVIGGIAWYFTSDVFRTRVDATARDLSKWTPENIAKEPALYLDFVETETNKALMSLKANKIAVAQNRAKLQDMRDNSASKISNGEKALTELKSAYRKADAEKTFPVQWKDKSYDQDGMKRQITSLNTAVDRENTLRSKVDNGLKQLDAQEVKIQDAEAKAQEQLAEVRANRELLKVQKLTDDLQDRLVSMRGALQATVATASQSGSVVTLDELQAESATAVNEEDFQKIMAE